jgi:hypothetical protein
MVNYADFIGFWPFLGGSGARFEAKSWEEVGIGSPTQDLYKSEVFDSPSSY